VNVIELAETNDQIQACYPVMVQLRSHLEVSSFIPRVRQQMQRGYQLAYLQNDVQVCTVTGFCISENLAWGRFMYVDDLVTDLEMRSQNYGHQILDWLVNYARQQDCQQLHLDSGLQRLDAHRFYQREDMQISGYHFVLNL
jgi:GNAT superfamily N-acetyltransferase